MFAMSLPHTSKLKKKRKKKARGRWPRCGQRPLIAKRESFYTVVAENSEFMLTNNHLTRQQKKK
jgi:hypothetical protein